MKWSIDGMEWNIPCTIEREAEVRSSDISGLLLNKSYFNDVIGTYMKYTVAIAVPKGMEEIYSTLYELLTNPVDGHTFILPYNDGSLTINARVTNVHDAYVRMAGDKNYWRGTKFDIIANSPTKTMDLDEIISAGLNPYPEVPEANVGDIYEYTSGGWTARNYADGDTVAY